MTAKILEFPLERRVFKTEKEAMDAAMMSGQSCMWWQDKDGNFRVKRTKATMGRADDGKLQVKIDDPEIGLKLLDIIKRENEEQDG